MTNFVIQAVICAERGREGESRDPQRRFGFREEIRLELDVAASRSMARPSKTRSIQVELLLGHSLKPSLSRCMRPQAHRSRHPFDGARAPKRDVTGEGENWTCWGPSRAQCGGLLAANRKPLLQTYDWQDLLR